MNALSTPVAGELPGLQDLRGEMGLLREEVSQAVDSLVEGLLALQDQRVAPLEARLEGLGQGLQRLGQLPQLLKQLDDKINRTWRELELERARHSLAQASRISPKDRTVVFVGRLHFGDNVKYAWLQALEHARGAGWDCWYLPPDEKQETLVRSTGARCLPWRQDQWTAEHVAVAQRTAVLVIGDHFFAAGQPGNSLAPALFAGARWVQLWHGISIKEIALRNPPPLGSMTLYQAEALASCGRYAAFVGSSAAAEVEWRRWFGFEAYACTGYPRSDVLLREPTPGDLLNVDTEALDLARATRAAGGRVVLYAPTFRDHLPGRWLHGLGLDSLGGALARRGDLLLVNLHPLEHREQPALAQACPQVRFLREHADLYPVLREVDLMVTDYSSLMFDFLPLDRPMLFFRPDHEDYLLHSRALYDGKVPALPGATCTTLPQLTEVLTGDWRGIDGEHAACRKALRERLFDRVDAGASHRVCALIEHQLELALAASAR
jgi:CDP-glycerol glycerophosphotransferase